MIFDDYQEAWQLWRQVSSGYLSDAVWTFQSTISGRFEPVMGDEEFLNNQAFANVTELAFLPITYKSTIKPGDGFVDADGTQRKIVGRPEIWKNDLVCAHVVCKMERVQWTVIS